MNMKKILLLLLFIIPSLVSAISDKIESNIKEKKYRWNKCYKRNKYFRRRRFFWSC